MKKVIKVPLSKQGLSNLLNKFNELKNDLKKCDENIKEKLADYTKSEIEKNLSSTPYKDGNDDVKTFKEKRSGKVVVGMRGTQVLYDEFGTGTKGEQSSHPLKDKYSLRGYNTGRKIRTATEKVNEKTGISIGQKYWTYKNKQGDIIYTTGIPAGRQVFNANESLKKKKIEIVKKEVGEVLSKL